MPFQSMATLGPTYASFHQLVFPNSRHMYVTYSTQSFLRVRLLGLIGKPSQPPQAETRWEASSASQMSSLEASMKV